MNCAGPEPKQQDTQAVRPATATALVLVEPGAHSPNNTGSRLAAMGADVGFIAQLVACRDGLAGWRRYRREEPAVAAGLYQQRLDAAARHAATTLRNA